MEIKRKHPRVKGSRLSIDCSIDQKRKIKMLAALEDKSITDLILSLVDERFERCPLGHHHIPNSETIKVLEATDRGEDLEEYETEEEFWKAIGRDVKTKER